MGRRTGGRNAEGDEVCIYRVVFRMGCSCADYAIDGINITLLQWQWMGFSMGGGLVVDYDRVGWEQEGSKPWSSFAFMAVIFIKHMLEVLLGSNGHQGFKILRDHLVLEDHVPIKQCS